MSMADSFGVLQVELPTPLGSTEGRAVAGIASTGVLISARARAAPTFRPDTPTCLPKSRLAGSQQTRARNTLLNTVTDRPIPLSTSATVIGLIPFEGVVGV